MIKHGLYFTKLNKQINSQKRRGTKKFVLKHKENKEELNRSIFSGISLSDIQSYFTEVIRPNMR